ncbi:hypothetical protein WJ968_09010 [Achromobacter xylosoxidans]
MPPSRLFNAEGPTPRACFVLAALGKPKLVAETLAPADMERKREYGARHGEMTPRDRGGSRTGRNVARRVRRAVSGAVLVG